MGAGTVPENGADLPRGTRWFMSEGARAHDSCALGQEEQQLWRELRVSERKLPPLTVMSWLFSPLQVTTGRK